MDPLITEAMRRADVAWITVGSGPAAAVWCVWQDDALYVVTGPGEQRVPGLAEASAARVSARGDHGGLIVTWPAEVRRVAPDDPLWTAVVPALAAKRLNGPPATELMAHWAIGDVAVCRLTPA
jgi:hypothetical protein